jgi:SNF2 family DNA or RNA helicase
MDPSVSLRVDQTADLAYYIANPKCMNLSEPGTGKTPSVVVYQYYLWTVQSVGTAWVMPKSLLFKNKREILRFTGFKDEDVVILNGTPKQIEKQLASGAKVFLMSFRRWTISWKKLPDYVKAFMTDEHHKGFKSPNSQVCQAMFTAFKWNRFEYFLPMTGTLISGRLDSAYSAIHVIYPHYYTSYKAFLYQHAIYDFDDKIIGWRNHTKLAEIFRRHGIRRLFKDIHGEQEVVYHTEVCDMAPKQRAMYKEFEENALLELEDFFIGGTEPGVNFIRARQLMEHPNHFPDLTKPGENVFVDIIPDELPGKLESLDNHIEDHENTGKPLIIFSALVPQQRQIRDMLKKRGLSYGFMNGQEAEITGTKATRDEVDVAFQKGQVKFMIVSPMVADVGFNWQFCGEVEVDHVIFVTTDYLDTTILQAVQRAIRGNRSTPLWVLFLEYADSLDQHILSIAYRKSVDANKVDPTRRVLQLSRYEKNYKKEEIA